MKISDLNNEYIEEYCGINGNCENLNIYKEAALMFIVGYTGLSREEIDTHEDLTIAYLALINDMSFNRDYTINRDTINPCIQTILSMYSKNNIG